MKRLYIIITLLLAAAMLSACTRETTGSVQGATMTGDGEVIVDEEEEISDSE
ncbi:MAG: hypothetical protein ACI4KF_11310 [Huintestinicola sp.]